MLRNKQSSLSQSRTKRPRVGIVGLTSCEGCQFSLLDLGNRFFSLLKYVEIVEFRLMEERVFTTPKMDICFVEGSAVTKANEKKVKEIRKRSKILVVLGNCAALGGIHQIKNHHDKDKLAQETYFHSQAMDNPEIKRMSELVKVDYTIPGCPVNSLEFLRLLYSLLKGADFYIPPKPVCFECQARGYKCVLMEGQPCLGPVILGGCEAVCLKSAMPCQGCRGYFAGAQADNHFKHLRALGHSADEINHLLEIYGLRDSTLILKKDPSRNGSG